MEKGFIINEIKAGEDYIKKLGPGIVTGAADDDPSGIATYSQAGAQYGTGLIWMALWTLPFVATIQEMCARIALVTGQGLAANIKKRYTKNILYVCTILLFLANTLNIGANLGAMAKSIELIKPEIPFVFLVIFIGLFSLITEIIIPYKTLAKFLKYLVLSLFAYIFTGFLIDMNWSKLFVNGIIPNVDFTRSQIFIITGILGTTISPYLFFWQSSQEVESQIDEGKVTLKSRMGTNKDEIKDMRVDVWTGVFLSNLVMFFIIAVCANTLFVNGVTDIQTAADAAKALEPFAGSFATWLFAMGIIGTGLLSIPVLAGSSAYAISESLGWKEGLFYKLKEARSFYGIIGLSIIVGIIINFIGIDPIKALIYSAIANGIVSPIIIICIIGISSSEKIMGEFKNKKFTNFVGWIIAIFMSLAAIATIFAMFV